MTKMIKLSLAAAVAATGMSAAVVDNVKVDGKARLFYETNNKTAGVDLFDPTSGTNVNLLLTIGASADIGPVKVNLRSNALTTAGLENTIVVSSQQLTGGATNVDTQTFTDIANIQTTIGGTTVIVGKQELNTPMIFTEDWNITRNTFDANVLVNKGLVPNTTLVFADVQTTNTENYNHHLAVDGAFATTLNAEIVGAHTTIAGLPVNAYYYDVGAFNETVAWFDTKIAGVTVQHAIKDNTSTGATGTASAVAGSTKVAGLNVFAAYSTVSEDGQEFTNYATDKKTKLPTQAVYVDGADVAQAGADTWKIKLSGMSVGPVKLAVQHVVCDTNGVEDTETDIIATTKIGGVALKALFIQNEEANANKHERIRVYANYSF